MFPLIPVPVYLMCLMFFLHQEALLSGGVVALPAADGAAAGAGCVLVVKLKKDAHRQGSLQVPGCVDVAVGAPVVLPSAPRVYVEVLENVLPASVMPPDHWCRIARFPVAKTVEAFRAPRLHLVRGHVGSTRLIRSTIWVP